MMEQFEKWQSKREVKTIGYLNNSSAYNAGEEAGWRAALKWIKREAISLDERGDISRGIINKELGEPNDQS